MKFGTYRIRKALERRILARSGVLARYLRCGLPVFAPWRRHRLDVVRDRGLGDVLMCTPALREAKLANPLLRIFFYTDFGDLIRGLPYIDDVFPTELAPKAAHYLGYEDATPPKVHLAKILGDRLGVKVRDVRPDCIINHNLVQKYKESWGVGPNIIILRRASRWTPNKDWPMSSWDELVKKLSDKYKIVEIGEKCDIPGNEQIRVNVDLRGKTDSAQLVAAIAAADLYVGPDSGPMHIAGAVGTKSVVIYGGYIHPVTTAYAGTWPLYTAVSCAPCWLREPCPYDRRCLAAISVDAVETAVAAALGSAVPYAATGGPSAGRR